MFVYQCPECVLKFTTGSELVQHLSLDHPDFHIESKTLEDALISASHRPRHAPQPHQD